MSLLESLDSLYKEAKESVADIVDKPGVYEGELISVKFDGKNKWSDGTQVPRVNLTFKVVEGDQKDNVIFVNLNLNGRTPEHRNTALSVFANTAKKLGVDLKDKGLQDTIKGLNEQLGAKATIEVVQNGEYLNTKVK